jgi:dinuclear metal center YbgI/SA1388 family protein
MIKTGDLTKFLNNKLNIKKFKDHSKNGLQIKSNNQIKKVGFSVDSCLDVFRKAKQKDCDLVIVHHGLLWKGHKLSNVDKKRISFLKNNKISLYACHLPLDKHPVLGNNVNLCKMLGIKQMKPLGKELVGYYGTRNISLNNIKKILDKKLKTNSKIFKFNNNKIKNIAVCSGGGAYELFDAKNKGCDVLVTGEFNHSKFHDAEEVGINIVSAGHYNTETVGVKELMKTIKENFEVDTIFIDSPTGL